MENATKALLIAAAVLVAILLIAFGMRIMNSAGDVSSQAGQVGADLSQQAGAAQGVAHDKLDDIGALIAGMS